MEHRTETSSSPRHRRRPSLTLSPHLASRPISVPSRHGSLSNRSPQSSHEPLPASSSLKRGSRGSFSSLSLSGSVNFGTASALQSSAIWDDQEDIEVDSGAWLDTRAGDIVFAGNEQVVRTDTDTRIEDAVNLLLESDSNHLLVGPAQNAAFFDIPVRNRQDRAMQNDWRALTTCPKRNDWELVQHIAKESLPFGASRRTATIVHDFVQSRCPSCRRGRGRCAKP
ncbi:uncharacterized protein I303_103677 [Kwoniella dejecticola CBS 10117]|uniref:Uncharacterized protein n=1 Tax=Kwoniella dejecticola CBS 10117 TaxID=1296121 RepID=A0AAJ8MGN5_9TREE